MKKKKIRRGFFETNSSSSHSITFAQDFVLDNSLGVDEGICTIYAGEFGWEVVDYYDARTKASYALTYAKVCGEIDLFIMLTEAIKEMTGCTYVEFKAIGHDDWGYIDHQSISSQVPQGAFESKQSLINFIFNSETLLHTDNDNH